jgi:hypothetical protein
VDNIFRCRNLPDIPQLVNSIDKGIPRRGNMQVSHTIVNNLLDAGEVIGTLTAGDREKESFFSFGIPIQRYFSMVCLKPVNHQLQVPGNGTGVDRGADDKEPCMPEGGDDGGHIIIEGAESGVITLVTSDACPDPEVIRVYYLNGESRCDCSL